jgi:hypothetical protein
MKQVIEVRGRQSGKRASQILDIDNKILDHAEKIIELMKLKGMVNHSTDIEFGIIDIWMKGDRIQVSNVCQKITTIDRNIKK